MHHWYTVVFIRAPDCCGHCIQSNSPSHASFEPAILNTAFLRVAAPMISSGCHPRNLRAVSACPLLPEEPKQRVVLRSEEKRLLLAALKLPWRQHWIFNCEVSAGLKGLQVRRAWSILTNIKSGAFSLPSSPFFLCLQDTKYLNPPDNCSRIYIFICLVYRKAVQAFGRGSYQRRTSTAIVFYCSSPFFPVNAGGSFSVGWVLVFCFCLLSPSLSLFLFFSFWAFITLLLSVFNHFW